MTEAADNYRVSAALQLLKAVASELRKIAADTMRFGETLSREASVVGPSVELLQKFDVVVQSIESQASFVDGLSMHLENGTENPAELRDLIEGIPFFAIRERLRGALFSTNGDAEPSFGDIPWEAWP